MGRKTWESIPPNRRPLPNRINAILTSSSDFKTQESDENGLVRIYSSFEDCVASLSADPSINEIFIFGGQALFELALGKYAKWCKLIMLTRINKDYESDVFLP
mmetsp:Transcript_16/g.23  ORF Transcript_16/g.23 Transcript_16/m.23 type:complete len:103 (-) Transcript_16:19-327(-)